MSLQDRVVVVLVEPIQPGNVGAVARAMRNMGLERLVLVNPLAYDPHRARWMAPGCDDLLARARIVGTLDEALEGAHRVIAATARHRRHGQPVLTPPALATQLLDGPDDVCTAILFGHEDLGLPSDVVHRCEAIVRIPTPEHASLNLGQAVLVIAHDLFEEARRRGLVAEGRTLGGHVVQSTRQVERRPEPRATLGELEPVVTDLVAVLTQVGYLRKATPDKIGVSATGALQRANLTKREVDALRGMLAHLGSALDATRNRAE